MASRHWPGKKPGRPLKVDRQTIVAVVAALREWLDTDDSARLAGYEPQVACDCQ